MTELIDRTKTFLILKYGSIVNAYDHLVSFHHTEKHGFTDLEYDIICEHMRDEGNTLN